MIVHDIAAETRYSLYGIHRLEIALLKECAKDGRRLVQIRVGGHLPLDQVTATIELVEMQFMLDNLFEAAEREDEEDS